MVLLHYLSLGLGSERPRPRAYCKSGVVLYYRYEMERVPWEEDQQLGTKPDFSDIPAMATCLLASSHAPRACGPRCPSSALSGTGSAWVCALRQVCDTKEPELGLGHPGKQDDGKGDLRKGAGGSGPGSSSCSQPLR